MKKLLAMYICVSALIYGSNAVASGLDMPPHDNSYTHHSLVPESVFDNSSSYQIARTYFMPDYQRNLVGKRVNDGGKEVTDRTCEAYGYLSSCPEHKKGSGVKHPISGLTCYEKCVCDTSYYKYNSLNCLLPKVLGGEFCGELTFNTGTLPSASGTRTSAGLSSTPTFQKSGEKTGYYTSCTCPAEYNLPSCPENAVCAVLTCDGKYAFNGCREGYTSYGYACIKNENCDAYPLTVCPTGGICSKCPDNNTKLKLDSCDTSKGWSLSGNNCVAKTCPAGYIAGVTSCSSNSTKPDYSSNGWSGGQPCGMCKCNNIDSTCTATNYPLTAQSDANANYSSCTTGCGSEKVTKYKMTGCKYSYKLNDAGTGCVEQTCQEIQSYYSTTIKEHRECKQDVYHNGKTVCLHACTCDPGYFMNQIYNCENCHQGTASNARSATRSEGCPVCPAGQYQNQKAQTSCKPCPAGTYQDLTGQASCKPCPADQYQDETGKGSCKTCPSGQVPNEQKTACVTADTCPTGYSKTACSDTQRMVNATYTETGTLCYKCQDCGKGIDAFVNQNTQTMECGVKCGSGSKAVCSCWTCKQDSYGLDRVPYGTYCLGYPYFASGKTPNNCERECMNTLSRVATNPYGDGCAHLSNYDDIRYCIQPYVNNYIYCITNCGTDQSETNQRCI